MSNIINVKEDKNILSFVGDVLPVVANSTNFYLSFTLDSEWAAVSVVTVVFDFDGKLEYVELDSNRKCKIPPTESGKILFCITASPGEHQKLSSTILSLDVEESGNTNLDGISVYENTHTELLGLVQDLLSGEVVAKTALSASTAALATRATTADTSTSQVSLTGDQTIAGVKNFTGSITHNGNGVPDCTEIASKNLIVNGDFQVNSRESNRYTRSGTDIYSSDRWGLFDYNGQFNTSNKTLTATDENGPVRFAQWIEDTNLIAGRRVCVSALINAVRYHGFVDVPLTFGDNDVSWVIQQTDNYIFRFYFRRSIAKYGVEFLVYNGNAIVIREVKVEISNYLTRFERKSLGEETELCHRYFIKFRFNHVGYAISDTIIRIHLPTPAVFRRAGSITISSYPTIILNGTTQTATAISIYQTYNDGIVFNVTGSGLTANTAYYLTNGIIKIDGEYY